MYKLLRLSSFIGRFYVNPMSNISYLNQKTAQAIDLELFNECKFSVDQLMELAGYSCAVALAETYSEKTHKNVLVCCGPGNNGGDGLGYYPTIIYPKQTENPLYCNLMHQCERMKIPILYEKTVDLTEFDVIVDALFGFSFKPPVRDNFLPIINSLISAERPVVSIDVPSGWDVENGPPQNKHIKPDLLISLTAPKMCASFYKGKHILGGRFIPSDMQSRYNLNLPKYPGHSPIVRID